jgi:heat shock protein HslJ
MACADPLMEAEQHFFHRLAGVRRFDLEDGELTLIADLGEIVAR